MVGILVAKRIHAIGTRALVSILDVSQLRIISIVGLLPLRVPAHELCFLGIYEIPLETGSDR